MSNFANFPATAKLAILTKVKKKTQFYYEQDKKNDDENTAEALLKSLNNI